jgi:eukaryotic-like serine/threonine-protein kinase
VLASLNHANVGAIYGVIQTDGVHGLVLELIEGSTLADRLTAGPLPIDEAIRFALQISAALEAAHDTGIIHRDLKPANIAITRDGVVKVLDFGLAKLGANGPTPVDRSRTPTVTIGGTREGVLVGTAAYMSPEQARGKPTDRRADIWAFGCVLYEMLIGAPAFIGETVTDVIAAVVRNEPDWARLPAVTPLAIRSLLRRCLQKDPGRRLQHVGDARIEIEEAVAQPMPQPTTVAPLPSGERLRAFVPWAVAIITIASLVVTQLGRQRPSAYIPSVVRLELNTPMDTKRLRLASSNALNASSPRTSAPNRRLLLVISDGLRPDAITSGSLASGRIHTFGTGSSRSTRRLASEECRPLHNPRQVWLDPQRPDAAGDGHRRTAGDPVFPRAVREMGVDRLTS